MLQEAVAISELEIILDELGAAAAEVVFTYFEKHQTRERNIKWLMRQIGREFSAGYEGLEQARELSSRITNKAERETVITKLRIALEEFEHYSALADVLEECLGVTVNSEEVLACGIRSENPDLPENTKKVQFERDLIQSGGRLGELALEISEGNGLGAFYALAKLKGGAFEERVAEANEKIVREEANHGPIHIRRAAELIQTQEELEQLKSMLRERGKFYLRMKNEQFDYPVPEDRLRKLEGGDVNQRLVQELKHYLHG